MITGMAPTGTQMGHNMSDQGALFLQRRRSSYYFRFRLPGAIQSLVRRREVRYSLGSRRISVARELIAAVMPAIYAVKGLGRRVKTLNEDEARRAAEFAIGRLLAVLRRSRASLSGRLLGLPQREAKPQGLLIRGGFDLPSLEDELSGRLPDPLGEMLMRLIFNGEPDSGIRFARRVLGMQGISADEQNESFKAFSARMLKVQRIIHDVSSRASARRLSG